MTNRIIIPDSLSNKEEEDVAIRPLRLEEFIGQESLIKQLKILIQSAIKRGEPLDHILLVGPPGLGKTTLANIISNEMRTTNIKSTSGPVLDRAGLVTILLGLKRGDVLFIDEIHRLNKVLEEILYPAMEDFYMDYVVGEGTDKKSIKFKIERFTLIGATTKIGYLTGPFRDRFGFTARLNLYQTDELIKILYRSASILGLPITHEGAKEIAEKCRGTPRIANRLLKRVRDYALVNNASEINRDITDAALELLGIDKGGFDETDRRILKVIANDFNGGPVGVKNIAISIGEEIRTIEDVYEPYLIHRGMIKRTLKGREITSKGMEYLNIEKIELPIIENIENKIKEDIKITPSGIAIIVDDKNRQKRYTKYGNAIAPIIPELRTLLSKSNDHKIRILAIDLARNMGKKFEDMTEDTFLNGIRYTLFHNNLYLEKRGKSSDDKTLLVIRERQKEDDLPHFLHDKEKIK